MRKQMFVIDKSPFPPNFPTSQCFTTSKQSSQNQNAAPTLAQLLHPSLLEWFQTHLGASFSATATITTYYREVAPFPAFRVLVWEFLGNVLWILGKWTLRGRRIKRLKGKTPRRPDYRKNWVSYSLWLPNYVFN